MGEGEGRRGRLGGKVALNRSEGLECRGNMLHSELRGEGGGVPMSCV